MYRLRLVRLSDSEHRLYLTLHHIIFDGVSLYRVLLPELLTFYDAFARNESPVLPELPIQYPDYAVWQRDSIKEISPEQLSYWQTVCDDLPVLDLKTDRPRPGQPDLCGRHGCFSALTRHDGRAEGFEPGTRRDSFHDHDRRLHGFVAWLHWRGGYRHRRRQQWSRSCRDR